MALEQVRGDERDINALRITRQPPQRRKPTSKVGLAVVAIVTLGLAGFTIYKRTFGQPLAVETIVVRQPLASERGVILTGSGYVVTRHKYITIGTKILGQIVEEPIEEGQQVRKGDLLARIDDRDYVAQLQQAIADHELAAANLRLKQAQEARVRELFNHQAASHDQLDVAENAAAVAAAEVKRAEAAIAFAKFNVSQCHIISPIDGVVLKKYRELGDTINYGGEIQTGGGATDIVQLADLGNMRAEVDINEIDISKVAMGNAALVTPDAYSNKTFDARVVKIYPEADRQKGTVKVEVELTEPDLTIVKPEMSVKVSFLADPPGTKKTATYIVVPKGAIIEKGGVRSVWVVRDGRAKLSPVTLGRTLEGGIEVQHGLDDGDRIILTPPPNLTDGLAVSVVTDNSAG